ncbi:MAG: response regulator transcription factor [Bacteriovoracaceae bacterium]|nr:response regulator transcription factor [Bacteriovoracaceae bacterium]
MPTDGILIVEDEKNLGQTLEEYLQGIGHHCKLAMTAKEAREIFNMTTPSVVLMDIGLPDGNGLDLAREFRGLRKDFSLIFLSALNDPETRVEGLEIGAEDYITKPFALKELVLRLDRINKFRVQTETLPDEIILGDLKISFNKFELTNAQGEQIPLSQKECAILELLYKNKNEAVNRETIIEEVWGLDKFPSNRTVDNYIVKLRKWAETDPNEPIAIVSIRGVGYKLVIKA